MQAMDGVVVMSARGLCSMSLILYTWLYIFEIQSSKINNRYYRFFTGR